MIEWGLVAVIVAVTAVIMGRLAWRSLRNTFGAGGAARAAARGAAELPALRGRTQGIGRRRAEAGVRH